MARSEGISRRGVLLGGGASLVFAPPAHAQDMSAAGGALRQILRDKVFPEIQAILPGDTFQITDFITGLVGLEAEAKQAKLPKSPLSLREVPLPTSLDGIYRAALPRLVALIDRSATKNPAFAERAGQLLAQLHGTQHRSAAWLSGDSSKRLSFDPGTEEPIMRLNDQAALPEIMSDLPDVTVPEPAPVIPVNRSLRFADVADELAARFAGAVVRDEFSESADWHLTMLRRNRERYEAVGKTSGVPWYFIGVVHGLEASFNFRGHLHNGDFPLSARTRQVPAGRPLRWLPPSSWEESATDALNLMGFAGASDWTLSRTLYRLEAYNGFGYRRIGRVSPYLWSFSNQYERGKFVADGRFNLAARSQQCGAAVMLKMLADKGDIILAT